MLNIVNSAPKANCYPILCEARKIGKSKIFPGLIVPMLRSISITSSIVCSVSCKTIIRTRKTCSYLFGLQNRSLY